MKSGVGVYVCIELISVLPQCYNLVITSLRHQQRLLLHALHSSMGISLVNANATAGEIETKGKKKEKKIIVDLMHHKNVVMSYFNERIQSFTYVTRVQNIYIASS